MPHMATWEDIKFWSGVRMEQEEILDRSLCWGFCSKGKAEEGKQHRLAGLNNIGGLQAVGVVFRCLAPGPRLI